MVAARHTPGRDKGTTASNAYGGSAYHAQGSGTTTATNAYGGSATHYAGYGTVATTSGQTAYHPPTAYYGYHPPATTAYYQTGCYNCVSTGGAAAAGAIVGMAAGAAAASSKASSESTSAYNAGYTAGASNASTANADAAVANANAAAANANAAAANANVAASHASSSPAGPSNDTYQMGAVYGALPAGCISPHVSGGGTYYLCGNTWFSPSYGANGIIYRVVPTP